MQISIPLTMKWITTHRFVRVLHWMPKCPKACERTLYEALCTLSTISLLLLPPLHITVASRLTLELLWPSASCLEPLKSRITKWTCNAQGLLNLKLSLSAEAWQKLMVQRGSNRVPADVCKCCHQCMHTPHASPLSLSWINPKARKISACSSQIAPRSKKICAFWNDLIRGLIWRHIAFRLNPASDSKPYEAYKGASI